jgi:uncharacterized protein (DUF433 family)
LVVETKQSNFEITPDQEAMLGRLQQVFDAPSTQEAVLRSSRVMLYLAESLTQGKHLYLGSTPSDVERLILPELEVPGDGWKWLTPRAHGWRSQLWVKGRRLLASQVWRDMLANEMTETEAAENWDLPLEAIQEIALYCADNTALIAAEADEERQQLRIQGVALEAAAR